MLVPELAGGADIHDLRKAVESLAGTLAAAADRWVVVGAGDTDDVRELRGTGTFAGFGADVAVHLGGNDLGAPDPLMPLPGLIAGWVRATWTPHVALDVRLVPRAWDRAQATEFGRGLRARLDREREVSAVLVVADGATTLTERAPGAFDHRGPELQARLDDALAGGDPSALAEVPGALAREVGVSAVAAWYTLAGLFDGAPPADVVELYRAAPFGVGYHVGAWRG